MTGEDRKVDRRIGEVPPAPPDTPLGEWCHVPGFPYNLVKFGVVDGTIRVVEILFDDTAD